MQPDTLAQNGTATAPTPAEQWDQVAFHLIRQELAPNGYKKIRSGKYEVSNIDYLTKKRVINCQKISAQLVRTFRGKAIKEIEAHIVRIQEDIKLHESRKFKFWQFAKRKDKKWRVQYQKDVIIGMKIAVKDLEKIGIK